MGPDESSVNFEIAWKSGPPSLKQKKESRETREKGEKHGKGPG